MDIDTLAKKLWDYHHLHQKLVKSDLILCLTSNDLRVAEYVAQLYHEGWAPMILFSGNRPAHEHDLRKTNWQMPEAEKFKEVAIAAGVPENVILVENKSTNSGEVVRFSYTLLEQKNMIPKSVILVEKPFMERRTWAIFKKQWPSSTTVAVVTSPPIAYEDYLTPEISKDDFINIMVGDMQRILEYPRLGFQIPQDVPDDVRVAYEELVQVGYTKGLISNA